MMLRRRVERKAKLVATVLFKEMANVRDWNSDCQNISVKQAKRVSKSVAAMRAGAMSSRPEVTASCSNAPLFNPFVKMNGKVSPGTVPRPVDLRPSRKCKRKVDARVCDLSVASCARKSVQASSTNSKERKDDCRQSEKTEGVRICNKLFKQAVTVPQLLGSLPSKHSSKLEQNLGGKIGRITPKAPSNSPKKYDGELSKKLSISVRIENGRIASARGIASKSEDATVPPMEKLVASLGNDSRQSSRMIAQGLPTAILANKFIISRGLKDRSYVTGNVDNRASIKEIFPSYIVSKNSKNIAMNSLPSHEKHDVELANNFFKSKTGKHKLDASVFGEVCVKLTKLDEKNLATGEAKCSSEFQRPKFSSICNSAKCTESAFTRKKKQGIAHLTAAAAAAGDSVAYPTGKMEDFLEIFRLTKKSEMKKSDIVPNRLHRKAGGKLRRFLKPRMTSEVVYRRSNARANNGVPPGGSLIRWRGKDSFSGTVNGAKGKVGSDPAFPDTADKIALLEKQVKENRRSLVILARRLSSEYNLSEFENKKSDSKSVILDLAPESSASRGKLAATEDDGDFVDQKKPGVHLAALSMCQSREGTETMPIVSMTTDAQNPEHSAHVLSANTDECEKPHQCESDFEKYLPQEDSLMPIELSKDDSAANSYLFSASVGVTEKRETLRGKGEKMVSSPVLRNFSSVGCKSLTRTNRRSETHKETLFKRLELLKAKKTPLCDEKEIANQKDMLAAGDNTSVDNNNPIGSKFDSYTLLTYWSKETDCAAPHMCSVCWVNDHMYCKNMRRTARDLPSIGGCIHCIPCYHYMQQNTNTANHELSNDECHKLAAGGGELQEVRRHWNDVDLICREEMLFFDWESPFVLRGGGENLHVQSHSVCLAGNSVLLEEEEAETGILPEEFGSEVFIENPDSDVLVELGLLEENGPCSAHIGMQRLENENAEPIDAKQNN